MYPQFYLEFAHQHRAGPAVTFPAADLGARQVLLIADKIQQGHSRRQGRGYFFFIENKMYQTNFMIVH